jgi:hypothetical protein
MQQITEEIAGRYAAAVHGVLADEFPGLKKRTMELAVLEQVGRQAEAPSPAFQLVVDEVSSANWRLVPHARYLSRVQLMCFTARPSDADDARERRLNVALRAIPQK